MTIAVVTGGGGDIGGAICARLARDGASVAVLDIDLERAISTASALPNALALRLDVTDSEAVDVCIDQVLCHFDRIDVLVNAAGVDDPEAKVEMVRQLDAGGPLNITSGLSDEQWDRLIRINLTGTFHCVRAVLKPMLVQKSGVIANIASIAGVHAIRGLPHYSASKAGVVGLTRSVALEVADRGIRINAIAPGGVNTAMIARWPGPPTVPIPAGRFAEVDKVAAAVAYLVSESAAYITGETLNINGGAFMP